MHIFPMKWCRRTSETVSIPTKDCSSSGAAMGSISALLISLMFLSAAFTKSHHIDQGLHIGNVVPGDTSGYPTSPFSLSPSTSDLTEVNAVDLQTEFTNAPRNGKLTRFVHPVLRTPSAFKVLVDVLRHHQVLLLNQCVDEKEDFNNLQLGGVSSKEMQMIPS